MSRNAKDMRDELEDELQRDIGATNGLPACGKTILSYLTDDKQPNFHNFVGTKMEQYKLTALACGGSAKGFDDFPPEGIDLKYYFCHMVEMVNKKTGEVIDACRIALIDKDDNVYSFVSDNLSRELDTLRSFFGNGPYIEPMIIVVEKIKTRSGMSTYVIKPVV